MMIRFNIPGIPVSWKAPSRNKKRFYSPHHYELKKAIQTIKMLRNENIISKGVRLDVTFGMPIPKYLKKKIKSGHPHTKKPDRSNLLKFIEDCLERAGVISNDSLIYDGHTRKIYSEYPGTLIELEVDDEKKD